MLSDVCLSGCLSSRVYVDEGESQGVGKAIGLLVSSEGDIPAVESYAEALKSGGGGAPVAAAAAAVEAPAKSETATAATSTPSTPGKLCPFFLPSLPLFQGELFGNFLCKLKNGKANVFVSLSPFFFPYRGEMS